MRLPWLERQLKRWSTSPAVKRVSMSRWELDMLIGELSRSFNHGELRADEQAVLDLCDRLEHAEQTGDGDLDCLAW